MFANLSTADRIARLLLALLLGWVALDFNVLWLLIPAFLAFLEFFFSWCVVYALMGRSTCPIRDPNRPWYERFNWLTWIIGVPIVLFCLAFLWMAWAFSQAY